MPISTLPAADAKELYAAAGPERENLCLYGHPDGNWSVDLPTEEVPPELPEPVLGINFARDGGFLERPARTGRTGKCSVEWQETAGLEDVLRLRVVSCFQARVAEEASRRGCVL